MEVIGKMQINEKRVSLGELVAQMKEMQALGFKTHFEGIGDGNTKLIVTFDNEN
jgi:hypothetical protein